MKKKLIFILVVFIAMASLGQSSKINVLQSKMVIGEDIKSHKEIIANEYIFPKRIHEIYVDTISGYITLKLRKLSKNGKVLDISGFVLVYDLINKKIKWDTRIEFTSADINQYSSFITQTSGNKLIALNIDNGEKLWSIKNDLYYLDQTNKIGIGYKYQGLAGNLHTLQGFNLNNGESLWEKELSRAYGWNKIIKMNDSTLLIAASGLHTINIYNGSGWDYNTETGKKDYTETIAKNVVGVTLGVLTGAYIVASGANVVREVVSNIVMDSSDIYIASKECVSKINKNNGHIIWTHPLPEDLTSKSSIFIQDSLMYLVNYGYAYFGGKKINFGTPFILGVNPKTGEQIFYKIISEEKNLICDFKTDKDTILIAFNNRLVKYALNDGSELNSKVINTEEFGEMKSFATDHVYSSRGDGVFSKLQELDFTKDYIHTSKRKILAIDHGLNVSNPFDYKSLYYDYGKIHDYKLLYNEDQTIILDGNNQEVAKLNVSYEGLLIGTTLYDFKDERLLVTDLNELFYNEQNP